MVSLSFSRLVLLCSVFAGLSSAAPAHRLTGDVTMFNHGGLKPHASKVSSRANKKPTMFNHFGGLDNTAGDIVSRATPAAPHFVIYSDKFVSGLTGPPDASAVDVRASIIH
jgi:hypothetical protein